MRVFFSILFILLFIAAWPQKIGSRSRTEKCWAFAHPFAALKVKRIYKRCLPFYEEIKKNSSLDAFENGGKLDAFRHVFFMAAFTQKIKVKTIRKLGIAHEKGNYHHFLKVIKEDGELPDSLSTVMDLKNNELGFTIGNTNRNKDLIDLKNLVVGEIKKGEAVYFKRNSTGHYLNCNDETIDLEKYKNRWFIPKCLIATNL